MITLVLDKDNVYLGGACTLVGRGSFLYTVCMYIGYY
jgi:hypothetical protein